MRPIVNLGKDSTARFKVVGPAAAAAASAAAGSGGRGERRGAAAGSESGTLLKRKGGRRHNLTLSFKPVNTVLQGSYHVCLTWV